MMQDENESDYNYFRRNAQRIIANAMLMGWVKRNPSKQRNDLDGLGQTPERARAKRLEKQRACMCALREKRKQNEQKEKRNGSN